ncbi:MAG: hypothetical protein RBS17_08210 [Coriobacteriia bacterium]|jgi:hypothetical protein|nr:hypothetical protein [Coriobacteriia bacterium]
MVRLRYSALTLLCFVVVVSSLSACSTENAGLDETTSQGSEASTVSASPSSDETATVESDDSSAWQPPVLPPRPTMDVEASQPSVADAAAALIRLADEADLLGEFVHESSTVEGMGRDSYGYWWVQGWVMISDPSWTGETGEQLFVVYDGTSWTLIGYGTGLMRSDYPSDIDWVDIDG